MIRAPSAQTMVTSVMNVEMRAFRYPGGIVILGLRMMIENRGEMATRLFRVVRAEGKC